jgi:hypothetical protein
VCGVSQLGRLSNLVLGRAEVEVAAEAQLEPVSVLGNLLPDLQRLERERQLRRLTSLNTDRALCAARLLQPRPGLLLDHDHPQPRRASASAAVTPQMPAPTTATSALRGVRRCRDQLH